MSNIVTEEKQMKHFYLLFSLFLCLSCSQTRDPNQELRDYLNFNLGGTHYEIVHVEEPDSSYSPLSSLLGSRYYMRDTNMKFQLSHKQLIVDDVTNNHWSDDLQLTMQKSDSIIKKYHKAAQQEYAKYLLPKREQPIPNCKIRKATLIISGDTVHGQFFYNADGKTIGHCITRIEKYMNDVEEEYKKWGLIRYSAELDLEKLASEHRH